MKQYTRETPQFSLCGLNCSLCPRYRTTGSSRCPGCGGEDFYEKHPSCGVISCSLRHGGVAYCFNCSEYPCDRYTRENDKDSFLSYMNVTKDMESAKTEGLDSYLEQLAKRSDVLDVLLQDWDNGRLKSYFCVAANLLSVKDLEHAMSELSGIANNLKNSSEANSSLYGRVAKEYFDKLASDRGISLKLRR